MHLPRKHLSLVLVFLKNQCVISNYFYIRLKKVSASFDYPYVGLCLPRLLWHPASDIHLICSLFLQHVELIDIEPPSHPSISSTEMSSSSYLQQNLPHIKTYGLLAGHSNPRNTNHWKALVSKILKFFPFSNRISNPFWYFVTLT